MPNDLEANIKLAMEHRSQCFLVFDVLTNYLGIVKITESHSAVLGSTPKKSAFLTK